MKMKVASGVWNDETQHLVHEVRGNYSSCTYRSSENICRNGGGANEKRKEGVKTRSNSLLSFTPPLEVGNVRFLTGLYFKIIIIT
jgi:hypothetical protein